jgi:hypothetical protein
MKITVVQNILLVLSAPWQPVILPKIGIVYDNEFDFINIWNCSMKFSTFDYFIWGTFPIYRLLKSSGFDCFFFYF